MRDSHRLKEKYELSLDNRQIVTLTITALVLLGGVFVLGVVVGKKLATEQQALAAAPRDLLSAADQKTAALQPAELEPSPALTFQDELTKKVEPAKPATPPPAPAVAPVAAAAPKPSPAPVVPASADTEREKPVATAAAAAVVARPSEEKPAPPVNPALPETVASAPTPTRTNDAGSLKEAFGKVARAPEPTPVPAVASGSWTLQLSAYQARTEADSFAAGLRDKGYAPYIVEAAVPGKGVWFRVRMGRFPTKDAATSYLSDFKRETSINGIVTSAN